MIRKIQEQLPEELRNMIGLMLHRNPAKRPKASVLVGILEFALGKQLYYV